MYRDPPPPYAWASDSRNSSNFSRSSRSFYTAELPQYCYSLMYPYYMYMWEGKYLDWSCYKCNVAMAPPIFHSYPHIISLSPCHLYPPPPPHHPVMYGPAFGFPPADFGQSCTANFSHFSQGKFYCLGLKSPGLGGGGGVTGGRGSTIRKFMKQKKPISTLLARVENNKPNVNLKFFETKC